MNVKKVVKNSIRKQIFFSFSIISVLLFIIGILFYSAVAQFKNQLQEAAPVQEQLLRAQSIIWLDEVLTHSIKSYIYSKDESWKNRYDEYGAKLDGVIAEAQKNAVGDKAKALFNRQKEANDQLVKMETQAFDFMKEGLGDQALAAIQGKEYLQWKQKYTEAINEFLKSSEAGQYAFREVIDANLQHAAMVSQYTLGGAILIGLGIVLFGYWISKWIVKSMQMVSGVTQEIAEGNLAADSATSSLAEINQLLQAIDEMKTRLQEMVVKVQTTVKAVNSAAAEIAQGSSDLAQRTEEQASALEETASSMEELTGTVKQSADNAGQANQLAVAARHQAEQGGQVVDQAVTAMSAIHQSSKRIADIIGVIDEIAFQTNLLALNAAVEAARAGEQGRGFAVVAGEVRKLAQRSADAAKEIKSLITDSVAKVEDGGQLVERSGQTLKEIVTAIKKVSDIVAEMAAASREQASGIEQVNKAILQMDQMTQQNAALVEQTASASHSMGDQASELQQLMSFFKLDGRETANAVVTVPSSGTASKARNASRMIQKMDHRPVAAGKPMPVKPRPAGRPAPVAKKSAPISTTSDEWEEF